MLQTIDLRYTKNVKVRFENNVLTFEFGDYDEVNILIDDEIAKSLHNVTRKLYPSYSVNAKTEKVCFVFETESTPTSQMQLFLKGLKLNEVIA